MSSKRKYIYKSFGGISGKDLIDTIKEQRRLTFFQNIKSQREKQSFYKRQIIYPEDIEVTLSDLYDYNKSKTDKKFKEEEDSREDIDFPPLPSYELSDVFKDPFMDCKKFLENPDIDPKTGLPFVDKVFREMIVNECKDYIDEYNDVLVIFEKQQKERLYETEKQRLEKYKEEEIKKIEYKKLLTSSIEIIKEKSDSIIKKQDLDLTKTNIIYILSFIYLTVKYNSVACFPFYQSRSLLKSYEEFMILLDKLSIVWESTKNKLYIYKDFYDFYNICNSRFILFPLIISYRTLTNSFSHANILILDTVEKTVERFEPNGGLETFITSEFNYNYPYLDAGIEKLFKTIDKNISYLSPVNFCPVEGLQMIESREVSETKSTKDPLGFCATWSMFYLEQRLMFPDIPRDTLIISIIEIFRENKKSLKEFIRNYSYILAMISTKIELMCIKTKKYLSYGDIVNCVKQLKI